MVVFWTFQLPILILEKNILDIEKDFQNKKLNKSNFSLFVQLFHIFSSFSVLVCQSSKDFSNKPGHVM